MTTQRTGWHEFKIWLHLIRNHIFASSSREREQNIMVNFLENIMKRPILLKDGIGLEYLLYPGQNAQVYIQNNGNYEVAETKLCLDSIHPGMTVFDIGANIGIYTLLFAKLVGNSGVVHTFEPDIKNYRRLCANIYLNGFEEIVKANRLAVFSGTEKVKLHIFPDSVNAWHTLGNLEMPDPWNAGKSIVPVETLEIPAISLDDYCQNEKIDHVDFLKIDVEGAELDVLHGASKLFAAQKVKKVMFEISMPQIKGMGHQSSDLYTFFEEHGYATYAILPNGTLAKISEMQPSTYQNFLAVCEESVHSIHA